MFTSQDFFEYSLIFLAICIWAILKHIRDWIQSRNAYKKFLETTFGTDAELFDLVFIVVWYALTTGVLAVTVQLLLKVYAKVYQ
jgi:hypothetical protein